MSARNIILSTVIICLSVVGLSRGSAAEPSRRAQELYGTWVIDIPRTLANAKTSPKYTEQDAARLPGQLKLLRNLMKIEITAKSVVTFRGDRSQSLAYHVESSANNQVVLTGSARGQAVTLTFTLMDGDVINMRSSATDDMDYFIWARKR